MKAPWTALGSVYQADRCETRIDGCKILTLTRTDAPRQFDQYQAQQNVTKCDMLTSP
jgi:hypothetical protein